MMRGLLRAEENNFSMATFGVIHEAGHGCTNKILIPLTLRH